jgi:hypothetical protein
MSGSYRGSSLHPFLMMPAEALETGRGLLDEMETQCASRGTTPFPPLQLLLLHILIAVSQVHPCYALNTTYR